MRFLQTFIFAKNRVIIASLCRNLRLTFQSWTAICVRVCVFGGGGESVKLIVRSPYNNLGTIHLWPVDIAKKEEGTENNLSPVSGILTHARVTLQASSALVEGVKMATLSNLITKSDRKT